MDQIDHRVDVMFGCRLEQSAEVLETPLRGVEVLLESMKIPEHLFADRGFGRKERGVDVFGSAVTFKRVVGAGSVVERRDAEHAIRLGVHGQLVGGGTDVFGINNAEVRVGKFDRELEDRFEVGRIGLRREGRDQIVMIGKRQAGIVAGFARGEHKGRDLELVRQGEWAHVAGLARPRGAGVDVTVETRYFLGTGGRQRVGQRDTAPAIFEGVRREEFLRVG